MYVIVANEQEGKLAGLDIDIIKSTTGIYSAKEIAEMFKTIFYDKMIIDVTAIKEYTDAKTYKEFAEELDVDKTVFFIPEGNSICTPNFLAQLVGMGIYNFTTNLDGVKYLVKKSNTYNDVAHIQQMGGAQVAPQQQVSTEPMSNNNMAAQNMANSNMNVAPLPDTNMGMQNAPGGMQNQVSPMSQQQMISQPMPQQQMVSQPMPQQQMVSQPMPQQQMVSQQMLQQQIQPQQNVMNKIVKIGIRNVTEHAGATSLIFMLKKELASIYGENKVVAVEVNKNDFQFLNDRAMVSCTSNELKSVVEKFTGINVILIDLNDYEDNSICDEVLYLIEPSTLRLNKLIRRNKNVFGKLKDKKIILNKSLLTGKDVNELEYESGLRFIYNLPPVNDRKRNEVIAELLGKIGLIHSEAKDAGKIFGLFRR